MPRSPAHSRGKDPRMNSEFSPIQQGSLTGSFSFWKSTLVEEEKEEKESGGRREEEPPKSPLVLLSCLWDPRTSAVLCRHPRRNTVLVVAWHPVVYLPKQGFLCPGSKAPEYKQELQISVRLGCKFDVP